MAERTFDAEAGREHIHDLAKLIGRHVIQNLDALKSLPRSFDLLGLRAAFRHKKSECKKCEAEYGYEFQFSPQIFLTPDIYFEDDQLIQFMPASGFHLVVVFLSFVQNSIDDLPVMSLAPKRDSFQPPNENGSRGTGTPMLTPIIPALACSIT